MAVALTQRAARQLASFALLCALCGCGYGLAQRQAALAPYVGHGEADLIRGLGVPAQTYEVGGHRFLAYVDVRTAVIPGSYGPPPWGMWGPGSPWGWAGTPPEVVQSVCQTVFELADAKIIGFSLHGPGCG